MKTLFLIAALVAVCAAQVDECDIFNGDAKLVSTEGAACVADDVDLYCDPSHGLTCNWETEKCVKIPAEGESCTNTRVCQNGHYCQLNEDLEYTTCAKEGAVGDACNYAKYSNNDCKYGLFCYTSKCTLPATVTSTGTEDVRDSELCAHGHRWDFLTRRCIVASEVPCGSCDQVAGTACCNAETNKCELKDAACESEYTKDAQFLAGKRDRFNVLTLFDLFDDVTFTWDDFAESTRLACKYTACLVDQAPTDSGIAKAKASFCISPGSTVAATFGLVASVVALLLF